MNKLWKIISIVAVLNLLAVAGFAGYLASTGRVTRDRVLEATSVLAETPVERAEREAAEEQAAAEAAAALAASTEDIAADAQQRNEARVAMTVVDRERLERMQREVRNLQAQLRRERTQLERDRMAFEQSKIDFHEMRQRLNDIEGADQFQSSLAVLKGLKADEVKDILTTLLTEGKTEETIAYLAALPDRNRAKVISEFVKDRETEVAADLLESLRTRGLTPADPGANSG